MSPRPVSFALVSALALLAALGCSSSSGAPAASVHADLIGGDPASPAGTSAVWYSGGYTFNQANANPCSGVLIDVDEILTAAHCVDALDSKDRRLGTVDPVRYAPNTTINISNGATIDGSAYMFATKIVATRIHPEFASACASGCVNVTALGAPYATDLAIITLADPVPSCFGLPAQLGTANVGDVVQEDGFGCEAIGTTPSPARFKIATDTLVDPASLTSLSVDPVAFAANFVMTNGTDSGGAATVCEGDSGGPLFKGRIANGGTVVGINSAHLRPSGYVSAFSRVDTSATAAWMSDVRQAYPRPNVPLPGRGQPSNDPANPMSGVFPYSTVNLLSGAGTKCTGVILSSTTILTAASCRMDESTEITFFPTQQTPDLQAVRGSVVSVDVPPGVVCDPTVTGSFPATCYTGASSGSASDAVYADLAVLTLADPVPDGYTPVLLGSSGSDPSESTSSATPVSWQVAATRTSMTWAPAYDVIGGTIAGSFAAQSVFGLAEDSGDLLLQPSADFDNDAATPPPPLLVGIASAIGACRDQCPASCDSHLNSFTSVVDPVNYAWLQSYGASPAPAAATFGAGE